MPKGLAHHIIGTIAALLLALCAGAAWSVVALVTGNTAAWMVIPAAFIVVWSLGFLPPGPRMAHAVLVVLLLAACVAYSNFLGAASVIAHALGMPFLQALLTMGAEMAWAVATARTPPWAAAVLSVTPILAAAFVYRR